MGKQQGHQGQTIQQMFAGSQLDSITANRICFLRHLKLGHTLPIFVTILGKPPPTPNSSF